MKVCLFDIDGTLIRTGGAGQQAFEAALNKVFGIDSRGASVKFSGRTDRAIVQDFFVLHKINNTPQAWQQFRTAYLERLPSTLSANRGVVLPGILELLQALSTRDDVAVGLLTGNISAGAETKLKHYGLVHFFRFGGFGDEHLQRDGVAREALAEARRHVDQGLRPNDVWVIGDTPHDVSCARAIGAGALAVATGFSSREDLAATKPDLLLDDLTDPAPVFELLN